MFHRPMSNGTYDIALPEGLVPEGLFSFDVFVCIFRVVSSVAAQHPAASGRSDLNTPPFRLAPIADFSSAESATMVADRHAERAPVHGARLHDLPSHLMCSVIGTCLGLGTLRKLVARFVDIDRERATDLEIHHAAVELATAGEAGAKNLHKALDDHHAATIRRFRGAGSEAALEAMWREALQSGEVPGAYWAVLTHPRATTDLRARAFGEVHMLSHLVGAANRADIRRLVALERENAELRECRDEQQVRLAKLAAAHEDWMIERRTLARELAALRNAPPAD